MNDWGLGQSASVLGTVGSSCTPPAPVGTYLIIGGGACCLSTARLDKTARFGGCWLWRLGAWLYRAGARHCRELNPSELSIIYATAVHREYVNMSQQGGPNIIVIALLGGAAYLAWNWYQAQVAQANASAATNQPVTPTTPVGVLHSSHDTGANAGGGGGQQHHHSTGRPS